MHSFIVKRCPEVIPLVTDAVFEIEGYQFNQSITYTCEHGFEFSLTGLWTEVVTCQSDETWENIAPACTSNNYMKEIRYMFTKLITMNSHIYTPKYTK